jgi:hypothetical protein
LARKTKSNLAKENLKELEKKIKKEGLFLAITNIDNHPQLVIVNKSPDPKIPLKLRGFYVFKFIIPNRETENRPTKEGILYLRVLSHMGKINGITDGTVKMINQDTLSDNIIALKKNKGS